MLVLRSKACRTSLCRLASKTITEQEFAGLAEELAHILDSRTSWAEDSMASWEWW